MSEENTSENKELNENGNESIDTENTPQDTSGQQEEISSDLQTNGSELGLQKQEEPASEDAALQFSSNLDGLVKAALNGELSDDVRASLDKQGLGGHFDMIVNGHKAEIAKNDAEIISVVGGKDSYAELQEWALSNLDDSDIDAFNHAVLESGNIGLAKLAVEGLKARYTEANGRAPSKHIEAGGTANDSTRPYNNRDEYINETMSMKYRQDPEYAALVEAKRNVSGF